ncbi:MAG: hypothetical protein HYV97_10925 [Bdellovibrio sp.]|nr:hypothetical protein [Bdellovibrio sp.]
MKICNWLLALSLLCFVPLAMAKGYSKVDMYHSAVISFDTGRHELSSSDMQKLRTLIQEAQARGEISKVEVAAWSDVKHPTKGDLSKSSRDLADRRIKSIKTTLRRDLGKMKYISSFNMAESANWLARFFNTSEAELDAVFAKRENGALEREDFLIIKREGAPSKAVVVLKVEHKK